MTRISIDVQGLLSIEKSGRMLEQFCLYDKCCRCGEWCPQFLLEGTDLNLCQDARYENVEIIEGTKETSNILKYFKE